MNAILEITKESGEIIHSENFKLEEDAHDQFESLERVRSPHSYLTHTMNLSDYYGGGCIGSVRVVAVSAKGERYVRRELYRNA